MMRLTTLVVGDGALSWQSAGFTVQNGGKVVLKNLLIILDGNVPRTSWGFEGDVFPTMFGGVPVVDEIDAPSFVEHPNGISTVDHVVLRVNAPSLLKESFSAFNYVPRRETSDIYPGITQMFYRPFLNSPIIEVVGPSSETEEELNGVLWGATFVSTNIQKTKSFLGDNAGNIRKAKQQGREICTMRHKNLGIHLNIAIMSPHNSKL